MYRDNNRRQGCILVKVYRITDKIIVESKSLIMPIMINIKSLPKMIIKTTFIECNLNSYLSNISQRLFSTISKENETLDIKCTTNSKLRINCGIICSKSELEKVLRVNPNLIFLSKSNNFTDDVYIISNVVWNIN